ncbi:MAG: antitoxin [Holosporales bacterium]|jgi:antitoxin VapB
MTITQVFQSGGSQAVRLPKAFRFAGKEVFIAKEGDKVILSPKPLSWNDYFAEPAVATDDFLRDRQDTPPQERELF